MSDEREPPLSEPAPTATNLTGPTRLENGRRVADRYRIVEMLGLGAMGMVYRAHDEELDLEVALKVLRPEMGGDAALLERFRRELVLARQVTHKNVVRIHDIGKDGELVFLTMDLVDGRSLREILAADGPMEPERAAAIGVELARALDAAHEKGVVHRDLKPSNVMVDAAGSAYITDFGVARSISSAGLTSTGFVVGTPDYLSPEQVRGEDADGRSDIYALGILLVELLNGRLPASGATADETLARHLRGVPKRLEGLPDDVPANLRAILRRCLEPDRHRRYQTAGEVAGDLETLSKPPLQLPGARRLALVAAIAVGIVAVVLGAVWLWPRGDAAGAAAVAEGPGAIVILPFADETQRENLAWLANGIPELLFEALIRQPEIRVVNPQRVAQVVDDLKLEPGAFTEATLDLASELFDTSRLVTGSVRGTADGGLRVDARLVNPATGLSAAVFLHAEAAAGAPAELVEELRGKLLEALAVRQPASEMTLASEALPLYADAVPRLWRGDAPGALSLLERAVERDPDFGAAWLRLSQAYEATGRYGRALDASERAVEKLAASAAGSGDRLHLLARAQQARLAGEPERAQQVLRELVDAFPGDIESAIELADAYGGAGEFGQALELLAEIVQAAPANPRAWFLRAKYSILSGQSRTAVDEYLVRAMVLQNKLKNVQGQADVLNAFGVAYRELGEMEQAEESYQRAAELRKEIGDDRGYATSLRNLAQIAIFRGDFQGAERNLQAARETFEELGDEAGIADLYNEMGMMEEARSDYEAALRNFRAGLQIRRELGDQRAVAESLNNIGFANHQLGEYDDASVYWQQALDLYVETGNVEGQTTVRISLGQLETTRGDWQDAQQSLLEALAGARELGWEPAIATSQGHLGRVAQYQGRYAPALSYYDDALSRFRELGDERGIIEISLARAEALLEIGAHTQALELLAALAEPLESVGNPDQKAETERLEGEALLASGDAAGNARLRQAATTAAESANLALRLRIRLSRAAATGDLAELRAISDEARSLGDQRLELQAALELATALAAADRGDEVRGVLARLARMRRGSESWALAYRLHELEAGLARGEGGDASAAEQAARDELERIGSGLAPELAERLSAHVGLETADAA